VPGAQDAEARRSVGRLHGEGASQRTGRS
jgi:hypothetical protein